MFEYAGYDDDNFDEELLSPEAEFEAFCLFDEVRDHLRGASKAETSFDHINSAQVMLKETYPDNDIDGICGTTAVSYNPNKRITTVVYEQVVLVDETPKQALLLEFYRGAPFGFVFDPANHLQFERPADQTSNQPFIDNTEVIDKKIAELERYGDKNDPRIIAALAIYHASKTAHLAASPLQGAFAIWNIQAQCYDTIAYDPHDTTHIAEVQPEDFKSMRIWLSGANVPLDIV